MPESATLSTILVASEECIFGCIVILAPVHHHNTMAATPASVLASFRQLAPAEQDALFALWNQFVEDAARNRKPILHDTHEKLQQAYEQIKQILVQLGYELVEGHREEGWPANMPLAYCSVTDAARAIHYARDCPAPGAPKGKVYLYLRIDEDNFLYYK
jgi:hypothetical protein